MPVRLAVACVLAAPLLVTAAQDPRPQAIVLRGSKVLDGTGRVLANTAILVRGSRIEAVGPSSAASGATVYDLRGLTVLPGMIDGHAHLAWHFNKAGKLHTADDGETPVEGTLAIAGNAYETLRAGFTTVQSPGSPEDKELRDAIARGLIPGPRVITSLAPLIDRNLTPEQLRQAVRERKSQGADVIKIFASGSIRDGGVQTLSAAQLEAACGEAKAAGLRTLVHAHSAESMRAASAAGCTQIEHGVFATAEVLAFMAERGTYFDPHTCLIFRNYLSNRAKYQGIGNYNDSGFAMMERAIPLATGSFKRAIATPRLNVVFGTDAVAGAHGRNVEELICRVNEGGQKSMDAIVSATSLGAKALGMAQTIGSIAAGHTADIIAVDGDPLTDITALRRVVFVMKEGKVYWNERRPTSDASTALPSAVGRRASLSVPWPAYGGDPGGTKYSPLTYVNRDNVGRLAPAWSWQTGERPIPQTDSSKAARPGVFQVTPLAIGDTLFLSTPYNRVVALDGETGAELWSFDPGAYRWGQPSNGTGFVHRGVATWSDGRERRIFINSRWRLLAIDGATGKPIPSFGKNGEVNLIEGMRRAVRPEHYTNTSPPVVYRNLVIVGNGVGDRLVYRNDPPGDVQAFDVRTGRRVWVFNPIPQAGEFGNKTWEDGSAIYAGHTNVWAPFTVDTARGLVYLPVGTPSNDWYGGDRKGDNLFAESIVCLDARSGRRVWHFQTVHHGLWDYDLPAPPTLVTARQGGRTIDAVAVPTKMGFVYVFDRVTGRPLWPIEERPVAASDVPGERAARTQPFPSKPRPISKQGFGEDDVVDFTPDIRAAALAELRKYRSGPLFTPPSLQGTVTMPGSIGGAGWGGGAFDPETRTLYVKATNQPSLWRLVKRDAPSDTVDATYMADLPNSTLSIRVPAATAATGGSQGTAAADEAIPLNKPPYGTLTAIDLDSGEHRWQVTLGDSPQIRNHSALKGLDLPPLGVAGAPGPMVTAGGLVFLTGGGSTLYAIDKANGKTLWHADLGDRGYANPMTYRTRGGTQFVIIATGAGSNAKLMAFSIR